MSDLAIRVEQLSKRYRIGLKETQEDTLVGAIGAGLRRPIENLRRLRALSRFADSTADASDVIWALRDVSFDVKQGEVVGVIGRNGAGKSTLLKLLSRITEPTGGRATVWGRVGSLLEVGTGFHPELTGRENIFLNGCLLGMKKAEIERKFDEIVAFSGVEKFIDTPVKRYSSGMYVRLAFAVAAHLEPEILLLDEVLAVGDFDFQKKCLGKMKDVATDGRTVIFVSHNIGAIQGLCDRVILLDHGTAVDQGATDTIVQQYLAQGTSRPGERTWTDDSTAPGNDIVRVRALRVADGEGQVTTRFDVRDPIRIELEFDVLRPGHALMSRFVVSNQMGLRLFEALDNNDSPWSYHKPRPVGRYRTVCHIPGDFLNEGQLFVGYGIQTLVPARLEPHATDWNVLSFVVSDSRDTGGVRGDFPYDWGSIAGVRPRLRFSVEHTPAP